MTIQGIRSPPTKTRSSRACERGSLVDRSDLNAFEFGEPPRHAINDALRNACVLHRAHGAGERDRARVLARTLNSRIEHARDTGDMLEFVAVLHAVGRGGGADHNGFGLGHASLNRSVDVVPIRLDSDGSRAATVAGAAGGARGTSRYDHPQKKGYSYRNSRTFTEQICGRGNGGGGVPRTIHGSMLAHSVGSRVG